MSACLRRKPKVQNKSRHGTGKPSARASGGFILVLVARRSQAAQLHIGGVPESLSSGSVPGKRQHCSPAMLKCLRTNSIKIPDPDYTSLASVQQNHFFPHWAVINANTGLHYLCFSFYSSGRIFRRGLST